MSDLQNKLEKARRNSINPSDIDSIKEAIDALTQFDKAMERLGDELYMCTEDEYLNDDCAEIESRMQYAKTKRAEINK